MKVVEQAESPGSALKRLCQRDGRKQGWVAEQLGLSDSQLSNRVVGRVAFSLLEARELGRIFDVPAETFLHDGDDSAPRGGLGSFS
jgi:plasmid maintenance system antidote protein VapI